MPVEAPPAAVVPPPQPQAPTPPQAPAAPDGGSLDAFDRQFADLSEPPPPSKAPDAPAAPKSGAKPTLEQPKPDAPAKPPAAPPPADDDFTVPASGNIVQVRNFGKRMADKAKQSHQEAQQLKARIAELEKGGKPSPESAAVTEQLTTAQQKLADYERRLQLVDYQRSEDYAEKYNKPWLEAETQKDSDLKQLTVIVPNPDDPDNPGERPATADDWNEIYNMNIGQAARKAHQLFGPAQASFVMQHYTRLHECARKAFQAIQDHQANGEKLTKEQTAKEAQFVQEQEQRWNMSHKELLEKHAEWFAEHDGDKEWNEALAHGRQLAITKFTPVWNKLSPEQKVQLDAQIFHRAAAFSPLRRSVIKLRGELEAANKTISELRGSGPGPLEPKGESPKGGTKDWESEFDEKMGG